jgi:hypothetical protein
MLMAALLITDELMDARAALVEKSDGNTKAQANGEGSAEEREQNAIGSEHKRRAAAGGDI